MQGRGLRCWLRQKGEHRDTNQLWAHRFLGTEAGNEMKPSVRRHVHKHVNKFPIGLQGSSPRIEAMYAPDPVQATAIPPDTTPRARQISRGESKIAARIESKATAKTEL